MSSGPPASSSSDSDARKRSLGSLRMFAACAPGLEPWLAREVSEVVPASSPEIIPGGVELAGDRESLHRLLIGLGLASHVLVRVASFPVRSLDDLEGHVARLPWSGWLRRDEPRRLRVSAAQSRVHHTGAIEERVARAITTRLGDAPPVVDPADTSAEPPIPLNVRIVEDRCTISLDASGAPLHRRGYRLDPRRAPLREDIACALVVASGWDPTRPFVDPMCGSGTLAIEAARIATRRAPGLARRFAIERTALADPELLASIRAEAEARIEAAPAPIFARDRDAWGVAAARENARRAGVETAIQFAEGPLSTTREQLVQAGLENAPIAVVTNPPWGERLGEADALRPLYAALGSLVRSLPRATLTLAAHDRRLAYATGVPIESAFLTDLGGLKVAAMRSQPRGAAKPARS